MALKCVVHPNRSVKRFWTAKKAIAVACNAITRHGASAPAVLLGIEQCSKVQKEAKSREALAALEAAARALEDTNQLFDADAQFIQRFLFLTNIGAIAFRIIGSLGRAGKATTGAILILRELATVRLKQIVAQRAANDATLTAVRRAAANEAQFLRTGSF